MVRAPHPALVPHSPQNLALGVKAPPHDAHLVVLATAEPQCWQNLPPPVGFWHTTQVTASAAAPRSTAATRSAACLTAAAVAAFSAALGAHCSHSANCSLKQCLQT